MWERGLKLLNDCLFGSAPKSLPMWERGLKQIPRVGRAVLATSLPMWERGLKLLYGHYVVVPFYVAPHVGAWIETPYLKG